MKDYNARDLLRYRHQLICNQENGLYVPVILEIKSAKVGIMNIRGSIYHLLHKHAALRTVLFADDVDIKRKTVDYLSINIHTAKGNKEFQESYIGDFIAPFNILNEPLVRVSLYVYNLSEYLLLFDACRLLIDDASKEFICKDIAAYLNHEPDEEMESTTWSEIDYYEEFSRSVSYDKQKGEGLMKMMQMSTHGLSSHHSDAVYGNGTAYQICLDQDKIHELYNFARQKDTTPFVLILSVFGFLLYSRREYQSIEIGCLFPRMQFNRKNRVGQYTNIVPIIYQPDPTSSSLNRFIENYRRIVLEISQSHEDPVIEVWQDSTLQPDRCMDFMLIYHRDKAGKEIPIPGGEMHIAVNRQFSPPVGMELIVYEAVVETLEIFVNFNIAIYPLSVQDDIRESLKELLEKSVSGIDISQINRK